MFGENLAQRKVRVLGFVARWFSPERDGGEGKLRPGTLHLAADECDRKHKTSPYVMEIDGDGAAVAQFNLFLDPRRSRVNREAMADIHAVLRASSKDHGCTLLPDIREDRRSKGVRIKAVGQTHASGSMHEFTAQAADWFELELKVRVLQGQRRMNIFGSSISGLGSLGRPRSERGLRQSQFHQFSTVHGPSLPGAAVRQRV